MFEELIEKVDQQYYDKLFNQLCEIKETIQELQKSEQDLK